MSNFIYIVMLAIGYIGYLMDWLDVRDILYSKAHWVGLCKLKGIRLSYTGFFETMLISTTLVFWLLFHMKAFSTIHSTSWITGNITQWKQRLNREALFSRIVQPLKQLSTLPLTFIETLVCRKWIFVLRCYRYFTESEQPGLLVDVISSQYSSTDQKCLDCYEPMISLWTRNSVPFDVNCVMTLTETGPQIQITDEAKYSRTRYNWNTLNSECTFIYEDVNEYIYIPAIPSNTSNVIYFHYFMFSIIQCSWRTQCHSQVLCVENLS